VSRLFLLLVIVGTVTGLEILLGPVQARGRALFEDAFETGLSKWEAYGIGTAVVRASGDPAHGNVLVLVPNGDAYALVKDSNRFGPVRIEGDVLFPDNVDNYLGVVYNFGRRGRRTDFGAIYIKGNDSYLQVNPHRDLGVSRTIYPEFRAALIGPAAIRIGQWQRFAVEVVEYAAHFYVGGSSIPQLTFSGFERRGCDRASAAFGRRRRMGRQHPDYVHRAPVVYRTSNPESVARPLRSANRMDGRGALHRNRRHARTKS
jgi:hypothetical protein